MGETHLVFLGNVLLVFPVLLFLPGFVLSRTFLKIPIDSLVVETFFCRILLSFLLSSIMAMGLIYFGFFSGPNLTMAVVVLTFAIFLLKRFRFIRSLRGFRPSVGDFLAVAIAMSALYLFLWSSEEVKSTFSLGIHWARTGSLKATLELQGWSFLREGPLTSLWFGIIQSFFGMDISLWTVPVMSAFSVLTLFFWSRRLLGLWGAVPAALFLSSQFPSIWFGRLPEGHALSQMLILLAFYLSELFFNERNRGFLLAGLASLCLSVIARWEAIFFIPFFIGGQLLILKFKEPLVRLVSPVSRLIFPLALTWLFLAFKAPSHVLWAIPWHFWAMGSFGATIFILLRAQAKDLSFWVPLLLYPLFGVGREPEHPFYMLNLAGIIPVIMPSVGLFFGVLMSFFAQKGMIARGGVILILGVMSIVPIYTRRDLIFARDYFGGLKFYEDLKRSFLPNDLVFSNDDDFSNLLERLYGLKVYRIEKGRGWVERDFQREIRLWLKDGGKAYFLTKEDAPKMEGFRLHLDNVMRLRTMALEKSYAPPQERKLQDVFVRIYEVT